MSWKEFIADLVGSIAWPAVIALAISIFRTQIRGLLERPMRRGKAGPFEAEYEWAKATERVGTSVLSIKTATAGRDELDELLELAEKAPVAAILAAHNSAPMMALSQVLE